ncbi:hypothetical protein M409DRAFT_21048 [Zasmidium cellare ATCC 36951]|uniref:Uncharacterized protein n=1 Tax=Zasmidium cellare ATCC 36951 TaxID=1080233 RepID=A0A6A6CTD9_ZASCE|nr:uncharacterized protein M409DRAFT_21048 [Zasmidium cellare ATCC 36951]KAF2169039.1 hypothetical protein M409DRAFT_21048 [Zasmidium cellare ATCC 36951]
MAIPPVVDQLDKFLDLTNDEHQLFRQFNYSYVWNAVLLNSGIPIDTGINMISPKAAVGVPSVPSTYAFLPSGLEGVHSVFGSDHFLTDEQVKCRILDDAVTVRSVLEYNDSQGQETRLVDFHNDSPFLFTVPPDAVRAGFFDRLEKLLGASRTW